MCFQVREFCIGFAAPVYAADTAAEKDENVYVTLNDDGSVSSVYVVNEFTSDKAGTIIDYGDYSSVKNLTTDDAITQNGEKITVEAPEGKFYYQRNLKTTDIPWKISICYFLDGSEISTEDLAGKSGKLKIKMAISENKACEGNFFDNYLLQATVVLDTEKCSNITADGATAANVGKNRQLVYNLMAGQEKTIEISADVTDFEMDGITFQGIPMSFDIDTQIEDNIKEALEKYTGGDYEAVSFTSAKNTDIGLVQFAIRTDDIKKQEAEETEEITETSTSVVDKIKNLFKK